MIKSKEKSLDKQSNWQLISLLSRVSAMIVGIIQSFIILRILSQNDFGAVKIVLSLTALVGVSGAFGITSGSTREIARASEDKEVFKIFLTSLITRVLLILPFVFILFYFAERLAGDIQNKQQIIWALKISSLVLFVQSFQGVFNSVLSGLKKFKILFWFQSLISLVSIIFYVIFVYLFSFYGYFYALLAFNSVSTLILAFIAFSNFKKFYSLNFKDFKNIAKEILGISLVIYLVKIVFEYWQQSPILLSKDYVDLSQTAVIAFALFFESKIMVIRDTVTDVNLPYLSTAYKKDKKEFNIKFKRNFKKVTLFSTFICVGMVLFGGEVIFIVSNYIVKKNYNYSSVVLPLMVLGYWSYSLINVLKSSVFVPAKKLGLLMVVFIFLIFSVYSIFYIPLFLNEPLFKIAFSFGIGSFISLWLCSFLVYNKLNILIFDKNILILILISLIICLISILFNVFILKSILFIPFTLYCYKLLKNAKS